jgi:hypothetical protein
MAVAVLPKSTHVGRRDPNVRNVISFRFWPIQHSKRTVWRMLELLQTIVSAEEYYLLGYNALQSVESQPMFRRNTFPPLSGSKNKSIPVWKQVARQFPPKRRFVFNWIHGVISQKTVLFITTGVRTSNPTTALVLCEIFLPLRPLKYE